MKIFFGVIIGMFVSFCFSVGIIIEVVTAAIKEQDMRQVRRDAELMRLVPYVTDNRGAPVARDCVIFNERMMCRGKFNQHFQIQRTAP